MPRTAAVALLLLMGMSLSPGKAKADLTYTFVSPAYTATITTDGNTGPLSTGDIKQWVLESNGLTATGTGALIAIGVSATPTSLELDLTNTSSQLELGNPSGLANWTSDSIPPTFSLFQNGVINGTQSQAGWSFQTGESSSTAIIGTTAAPEPSTAVVAMIGTVGGLAYALVRERRSVRRQGAIGQPKLPE